MDKKWDANKTSKLQVLNEPTFSVRNNDLLTIYCIAIISSVLKLFRVIKIDITINQKQKLNYSYFANICH